MQIEISWLLQKPTDLDLHCLQRQGISGFSRTRVKTHQQVVKWMGSVWEKYGKELYCTNVNRVNTIIPFTAIKKINTVVNPITAHTPISTQSSNSILFRLHPMYFLSTLYKGFNIVGIHLNLIHLSMHSDTHNICSQKKNTKTIA